MTQHQREHPRALGSKNPSGMKSRRRGDGPSLLDGVRGTVSAVMASEGERGLAARWAVLLRYGAYLGGIAVASLIVGAYPPLGALATRLLQISCAMIVLAASVASIVYPTERRNLVDQMRFFLFGVICFPAVVLGALMSVVSGSTAGSSSQSLGASGDTVMVNLAHTTLPYLFWATVVVPPFIFVKMVVGLRKIHRDRTDDEEMMSRLSRQDQFFR